MGDEYDRMQDAMMDLAYEGHQAELMAELEDEVDARLHGEFVEWRAKHRKALDKHSLKKSQNRLVVLEALFRMANCRITHDPDELVGDLVDRLEKITPPKGHPDWGSYGKPDSMFHLFARLPDTGCVEVKFARGIEGKRGRVFTEMGLLPTGVLHLHHHGSITTADLISYFKFTKGDKEWETTNRYALGEPAPVGAHQFETEAWRFDILDAHFRKSADIMERYQQASARKMANLTEAAHNSDARTIYTNLKEEDRRVLTVAVLRHIEVGKAVFSQTIKVVEGADTYRGQIDVLVDLYARTFPEHPDSAYDADTPPDADSLKKAEDAIGELVARAAWHIVSRVMRHRMNDPIARPAFAARHRQQALAQGRFGTAQSGLRAFVRAMQADEKKMRDFAEALCLPFEQVEEALKNTSLPKF